MNEDPGNWPARYIETSNKSLWLFWNEQAEWSQSVFGLDSERGPQGPLKHLKKEVDEALANPADLMEYVDLLFLTFDSARRAGFTYQQVVDGAFHKLAINKGRKLVDSNNR